MSTDDPLKNWQLESGGNDPDQWKLQDAEQNLDKHMQLQPGEVGSQWQPVEYERATRPRRNWVLPSIIIVALLAVLAYVGWIAMSQLGNPGGLAGLSVGGINLGGMLPGANPPAPTPTVPAVVAAAEASATAEPPTPTVEPTQIATLAATATFTPEPPPTPATVEMITGTVNVEAGVNARAEPATSGTIVRLLTQGEPLTVVASQDGWLQVVLPENKVAWVSADFVDQVRQQVPREQLNAVRTAAGLPLLEAAPPPAPAATTNESVPPASLVVTVSSPTAANARMAPEATGTVITSVPSGSTLTAVGRSSDNQWLVVQLPDGALGWMLATFLTPDGDIVTLQPLEPTLLTTGAGTGNTSGITSTNEITGTAPALNQPSAPGLVTNGIVPPVPFTNTLPAAGPALAISDTTGVNARSAPTTTAELLVTVPDGAVLPVIGRTEAGDWLEVQLPDNRTAWMATAFVNASSDANSAPVAGGSTTSTLPVATPAAVGPTATATVVNQLGANFRSAPSMTLDPVLTVSMGQTFTAIGRTAANDWVQLALPDGTTAWAKSDTLSLDRDIGTLPVTQ